MKCYVVRDLLASYNDGLLEKETAKEIEQHLSECEECRKLNEKFNTEIPDNEKTDTANCKDMKPFKKVKKKLKHRVTTIVVLSVLLVVIVGSLGYLTIGQITKHNMYSFELIERDITGRKFAKNFISGNIDEIMKYIYLGNEDKYSGIYGYETEHPEEIYNDLCNKLKTAYEKDFSGKDLKFYSVRSYYSSKDCESFENSENSEVYTTTKISFYVDGNLKSIDLDKETGGKFTLHLYDNNGKYDFPELAKVLQNIEIINYTNERVQYLHKQSEKDESDFDRYYVCRQLEIYISYDEKETEKIQEKLKEFEKDGTRINRVLSTSPRYDFDKKTFYLILSFRIADGKTGKSAEYAVRCNIWNPDSSQNGFDFSYEDLLNDGVREEKIQQFKKIYSLS